MFGIRYRSKCTRSNSVAEPQGTCFQQIMGLNRPTSKKAMDDQQVCAKVFTILNHRGTQSEATLRCDLAPVRMAIPKDEG